jgi:hypothetical protein
MKSEMEPSAARLHARQQIATIPAPREAFHRAPIAKLVFA